MSYLPIVLIWLAYLAVPTVWFSVKVRRYARSEEWRTTEPTPPSSRGHLWREMMKVMLLVDLVALSWPVSIPLLEWAQRRERRRTA